MPCFSCGRGFHEECIVEDCDVCHPVTEAISPVSALGRGAPVKETNNLKDPLSTGRKRAAMLYPIDKDKDCEWRGKSNCGGGLRPITGCFEGKQRARHHGPVKLSATTVNNEPGNVHRICHSCHVRWHELNDLVYNEEEFARTRHDPTDCDIAEIMAYDALWTKGIMKTKYQLASSVKKEKVGNDD